MFRFLSALIPAGLLLTALAGSAAASPMEGTPASMHRHDPMERFAAMDGDADGRVSRQEFFKARPSFTEKAFELIDADHDGSVTKEEWAAFSSGHGGNMGGSGMGSMMKGMRGMGGPRPAEGSADPGGAASGAIPLVCRLLPRMPPERVRRAVPSRWSCRRRNRMTFSVLPAFRGGGAVDKRLGHTYITVPIPVRGAHRQTYREFT